MIAIDRHNNCVKVQINFDEMKFWMMMTFWKIYMCSLLYIVQCNVRHYDAQYYGLPNMFVHQKKRFIIFCFQINGFLKSYKLLLILFSRRYCLFYSRFVIEIRCDWASIVFFLRALLTMILTTTFGTICNMDHDNRLVYIKGTSTFAYSICTWI